MEFTFENQGINTYLVYQVGEKDKIDSMSMGMITNNKILGLAPVVFLQQDTTKYFKYNVSSKVSAEQFLMGSVTKKRIIGVFSGIVNAMISAEEYMLDASSICLDLKYIFTDVSTCETTLICLPVINDETAIVDFKSFFKNIVFSTQFDQTENCDYVAKLINYLNTASAFSLGDFKELLDSIERGVQTEKTVTTQTSEPVQSPTSTQSVPVQQASQVQPVQEVAPVPPVQQPVPTPVVQPKGVPVQSAPVSPVPPKPVTSTSGFAIPGQANATPVHPGKVESAEQTVEPDTEKEMSLMYLMRNYSKENAAIYKAQQDKKKAEKGTAEPKKKEKPAKADKKGAKVPPPVPPSFAVPGASAVALPIAKPVQQPQSSVTPVAPPVSQPVPPQQASYSAPVTEPVVPQPVVHTGNTANFGETTVLSSGMIGETTVLGVSPMVANTMPYLLRVKNNEKIILDKPVFRIGKERSFVDYFIGDNTAISRSHANIITRDGEYFVQDTNSTNHTYVNGQMIQSNVEVKIAHGTKIKLANEDFEFKIY